MTRFSGLTRVFSVILAAAMAAVFLSSCTKTPSDAEAFKALAKKNGFEIYDATDQYEKAPQITQVTIAAPEDRSFQIEFYTITDRETAKKLYIAMSDEVENYKNDGATGKVNNGRNYAKRIAVSDGMYLLVAYTENTIVYVPPTNEEANRDKIDKFLEELNY